jgi:hypothetical protein
MWIWADHHLDRAPEEGHRVVLVLALGFPAPEPIMSCRVPLLAGGRTLPSYLIDQVRRSSTQTLD